MKQSCARKRVVALLGGLMFALMGALGWQMEHGGMCRLPAALLISALLTLPVALLMAFLFEGRWKRLVPARLRALPRTQVPFRPGRAAALLMLCYLPVLAVTFPGSFAYDAPFQLRQVFTGAYSTHHPLLHTLLLGGCVALGRALGSINLGAALYTLVQMALLSACFALTCASIARRCGGRSARRALLCFALYPLHMLMAVNATKDVLFGGFFALTLALAFELAAGARGRGLLAGVTVSGTLAMLLRNNAVYAAAVWTALLILLWICGKGRRARRGVLALIACTVAAVALALVTNALLAAATHAQKGDAREMLSWPIQQLARARLMDADRLTGEEKQAIDELMPGEAWRQYDPTVSDPVKFAFDTQRLMEEPGRYLRVWLSVGRKCAGTYLDAALALTYPFFYPYGEYRVSGYYLQMGISTEQTEQWCDFEWITSQSLLPRVLGSLSWRFGAKGAMQIPVIGYWFNMGAIVWVMLALILREAYFGRWRRFAVGLLPVLLWGTFLLGPVMAGRYIYPFVCALPVLACRAAGDEQGED